MEIILLCGPKNSGKTTTINIAYCLCIKQVQSITDLKWNRMSGSKWDFKASFEYKGKKISFVSMGDIKYETLIYRINKNRKNNCDILIIAFSCEDFEILNKDIFKEMKIVKKNKVDDNSFSEMFYENTDKANVIVDHIIKMIHIQQ